jgi:hypothetical protein
MYKWGNSGKCQYATKADCKAANPNNKYETDRDSLTRITELVISDENKELSIDCISLVSQPAIEVNAVFLNKAKQRLTLAKADEEKRMLISPALIPNKQIIRYNPENNLEYYVFFSKKTVEQASIMYLKYNNHHKATAQHEERISGILTVESWIIEDPKHDKANLYGYKNLPAGTWMVKMKIDNEDVWKRIKDGEIKGLSIEGYFVDKLEKLSKPAEPTNEEILKELLNIIKN